LEKLNRLRVEMIPSARVVEILADGVVVDRNGRTERLKGFDSIVLAMGTVSDSGLYERLKGVIPEVHLVGDARKPAKILEALTDAMELAQQI